MKYLMRCSLRNGVVTAMCALVLAAGTTDVRSDSYDTEILAPGLKVHTIKRDEGPWQIRVLEMVRRTDDALESGVVLGGEHVMGIVPLDRVIRKMPQDGRRIKGAVNGDFYVLSAGPFQGDPIGLCVVDRELVSTPIGRSAVVFGEDESISIGVFGFEGSVKSADGRSYSLRGVNQHCPDDAIVALTYRFNDETRPEEGAKIAVLGGMDMPLEPEGVSYLNVTAIADGDSALVIPSETILLVGKGTGADFIGTLKPESKVMMTLKLNSSPGEIVDAVGGGPRLMRDGSVSIEHEREGISQKFVDDRHPRTALGYNTESLFFVTVDGRQEGWSAGMNLHELAEFMRELGCAEAINLDGGGSTTFWSDGKIRNRPSDGRVRPIANGVVVYEREAK